MLLLVVMLTMSSCKNGILGDEENEYKEVAKLDFPIKAVRTLNPATSKDQDTYFISRLIYDGLFELDKNLIPKNNLASSYKFNKKSNSIDINLISTKFHDGKSFTANDVKFTVESYKAAGSNCLYYPLVKNIYSVDVKDSNDITVYFNDGAHMSLDYLTFPILPKHRYDGVYDIIYRAAATFKPVGTGRYKFKEFIEGKDIKLDANENYHGQSPTNSLTFSVVENPNTAYQLVEASSLSAIFTTDINKEKNLQKKKQVIKEFPSNEAEFVGFNMSGEATSIKEVRKAIAYTIDNSDIIHDVFSNSGIDNDSLYYPNYLGVKSGKNPYKYSRKNALEQLKKAGYEDKNNDGRVENSVGATISLNILVNGNKKYKIKEAEIIKKNLEDVGIGSYITTVPDKLYKKSLERGKFDIFIGSLKYDGAMDLRNLLEFPKPQEVVLRESYSGGNNSQKSDNKKSYSSKDTNLYNNNSNNKNGTKDKEKLLKEKKKRLELKVLKNMRPSNLNYGRYYNGELNDLMDKMKAGIDIKTMKVTLKKIKDILNEEVPYYCIMQRTYSAIQSPSLNGNLSPMFDNYYMGIEQLGSKYEVIKEKKEKETDVKQ